MTPLDDADLRGITERIEIARGKPDEYWTSPLAAAEVCVDALDLIADNAALRARIAELTATVARMGDGNLTALEIAARAIGARLDAEARVAALETAARALVEALPLCTQFEGEHYCCFRIATRAYERGEDRWCDTHGDSVPEYPHAALLRALVAMLPSAATKPNDGGPT